MHNRTVLVTFLSVAFLVVAASASQAGFEYVPNGGASAEAPKTEDILSPAPAAMPAPVEKVHVLPLPSEIQPVTQAPQQNGFLHAPQNAIKQPAVTSPEPSNAPKMQIKTITPAKADPSIRWNPQRAAQAMDAPVIAPVKNELMDVKIESTLPMPSSEESAVERKPLIVPPVQSISVPVETETKIVLPDDAPQSATNAMPRNLIKSFPNEKNRPQSDMDVVMPEAEKENASPSDTGVAMEVVDGFGSDMPLAIALQQIAPAGYTFSFGDGVNPGARVSWDSKGQPWNQVIETMIAPLGLKIDIRDKTVRVHNPEFSAVTPNIESAAVNAPPIHVADKSEIDVRRMNLTDPGEVQKPQPLSMPAPAAVEAARSSSNTSSAVSPHSDAVTIEIIEPAAGEASIKVEEAPASILGPQTKADGIQPTANMAKPALKAEAENAVLALNTALNQNEKKTSTSATPATPDNLLETTALSVNENTVKQPAPGAKQFFVTPGQWTAQNGQSLKEVLALWSKEAGVSISWETSQDFTLAANVSIEDTFQGAVQTLMEKGLKDKAKPNITFQIPAERGKAGVLLIQDSIGLLKKQG